MNGDPVWWGTEGGQGWYSWIELGILSMLSVRWDLVTCVFQKLVNGSDVYHALRTVDVKIKKKIQRTMDVDR